MAAVAVCVAASALGGCRSIAPRDLAPRQVHDWERSHRDQLCAEDSVRAARAAVPEGSQRFLAEACNAGDDRACSVLGVMYETGRGLPVDAARAAALFSHACAQDNLRGCVNLGRLELADGAVDASLSAARRFDAACQLGSAEGCYRLGRLRHGAAKTDAERDLAAWLFTRSCASGYSDACFELGLMHHGMSSPTPTDSVAVRACPAGACGD